MLVNIAVNHTEMMSVNILDFLIIKNSHKKIPDILSGIFLTAVFDVLPGERHSIVPLRKRSSTFGANKRARSSNSVELALEIGC